MKMVKLRGAAYCNLKFLLIFLVVYGHMIEPQIWKNPVILAQYRWIYAVHMPLFSFLAGLFLTNVRSCGMQLGRCLSLYLFFQTAAVFLGDGKVMPLTPYWLLWYLLSTACWCAIAWLWFRLCRGRVGIILLLSGIGAGCLAGLVPTVNREYSLSRTLVFFPYFMAGILCRKQKNWAVFRWSALIVGILSACVMLTSMSHISPYFFYHAAPYKNAGQLFDRLLCYGVGFGLSYFLLSWIPRVHLPVTKLGTQTMSAYLAQTPFVLMAKRWELPWPYYILLTGGYLWVVYLLTHYKNLYGIRR